MKKYLLSTACLLLTALSFAAQSEEGKTIPVSKSVLPVERLVDGRVQAVNQATVSAETSGRVQEILYDVGDEVPAGAVIIKLVSTQQREGYNQAVAALAEATANLELQQKEFTRIEEVYKRKLVAKNDYDRAAGNLASAKAHVTSARAAVKTAQERLSYTLVKAPFGGVVYARHVELGEAVQPGTPLMSGFDPTALRVEADLPEAVADSLGQLGKARVVSEKGVSIKPEKIEIFPQADAATGTVHIRLELPKQSTGLRPGQFVKVAIVTGEQARLLVPVSSIMHRSEINAVYVAGKSGWQLRQVRPGNRFGDKIEILAGVSENEKVAVNAVKAGIEAAVAVKKEAAAHE